MKTQKMNLKFVAIATFLFVTTYIQAQVKVDNTTTIGTNNNFEVEATNAKKVVVKSASGQLIVGYSGATVPTGGTNTALIVNNGTTNGAVQIKDGTEGDGKVLTSDANGVGYWKTPTGLLTQGNVTLQTKAITSGVSLYMDSSITLQPGMYVIYAIAQFLQIQSPGFVNLRLSSSSSSFVQVPGSSFISGYNQVAGSNVFTNGYSNPITLTSPTTIYLWAYSQSNGIVALNKNEGNFYAIKVN